MDEKNDGLEQKNNDVNSKKKLEAAEKIRRDFEVYKDLPKSRKEKVVSLVDEILSVAVEIRDKTGGRVASSDKNDAKKSAENDGNDEENLMENGDAERENNDENSEKNGGIDPRKNNDADAENDERNSIENDDRNSVKKIGIAEKFRRYLKAYKGLPRGRKQKVVSLIAMILLVVIVAPIVIGALMSSGGERYLFSVEYDKKGGTVVVEAAGKEKDGGILAEVGSTVVLKAEAKPHYSFAGWFDGARAFPDVDSYLDTELSFRMIKADLKLTAEFSLDTYGLKVTSTVDGEASNKGKFRVEFNGVYDVAYGISNKDTFEKGYEEGSQIALSIAYKSQSTDYDIAGGYGFWGWFENGEKLSGDAAYSFIMGTEKRDIEARFYKVFGAGESITYDEDLDLVTASSGTGNDTDPYVYEFSTKEQLALFAKRINERGYYGDYEFYANIHEKFVLAGDINLCGAEWIPIGNADNKFKYTFDGRGFEIANFKINISADSKTVYAGLFGYVTYGAEIKNLKISGAEIISAASNAEKIYAGVVAGKVEGADLSNLTVVGGKLEIKGKMVYVGMIAGEIAEKHIASEICAVDKTTGKVLGKAEYTYEAGEIRVEAGVKGYVGGLVGYFNNIGGEIRASSSTVKVWSSESKGTVYSGSLVGACRTTADLSSAEATGTVNGKIGGKVGGTGITD